jgi:hypothetical protein
MKAGIQQYRRLLIMFSFDLVHILIDFYLTKSMFVINLIIYQAPRLDGSLLFKHSQSRHNKTYIGYMCLL